jgi:hypothetical protein
LSDTPLSATPLPQLTPAHITCSRGMADWLRANQVSLAFTSYQTGRLYLVGVDEAGGLAIHEVGTGRAMGLWVDPQRLVLATAWLLPAMFRVPPAPVPWRRVDDAMVSTTSGWRPIPRWSLEHHMTISTG